MNSPPSACGSAARRTKVFRPAKGVVFGFLGGDFVLFSEPRQNVYRFEPPSASAWLGMSEGEAPGSTTRRIAEEIQCSLERAEELILSWQSEWERLGLLGESLAEPDERQIRNDDEPPCIPASAELYHIAGTGIAISFPDDSSKHAWDAIAGHLRDTSGPAEIKLAVEPRDGGYRMIGPSGERLDLANPAAVAVSLKESVLYALLERDSRWIALHAAAISAQSGSVLLAGSSGRGKTTLTAVLNTLGLPVIADDVTLVSDASLGIRGLPFAFAAKPGSWDVLRPRYPTLDQLPEFERPDGRVVRYVKPSRISGQAGPVSAVVFPQYSQATPLRITEMTKVAGLLSLLEEAVNAKRWLTGEGFVGLLAMVERATVIGLEYDDVSAAAEWMKVNLAHTGQAGRNAF